METGVILTRTGDIATLTLNNPTKYNALSRQVVDSLKAAVEELAVDRKARAVVIHGGDAKAFCSGADLKERLGMPEPKVVEAVHLLRETFVALERLPMPTIAAIHGMALGGGCELALACDLRILADSAQIGLTEVGWAIIPGAGGTQRLPRYVGLAKAKELIFTAAKLSATEALELGLANQVVPAAELQARAYAIAETIAQQGPLAVRAAKRALNGGAALEHGLALEWEAYQTIIPTADRLEGLAAFAEKRKPQYKGM